MFCNKPAYPPHGFTSLSTRTPRASPKDPRCSAPSSTLFTDIGLRKKYTQGGAGYRRLTGAGKQRKEKSNRVWGGGTLGVSSYARECANLIRSYHGKSLDQPKQQKLVFEFANSHLAQYERNLDAFEAAHLQFASLPYVVTR